MEVPCEFAVGPILYRAVCDISRFYEFEGGYRGRTAGDVDSCHIVGTCCGSGHLRGGDVQHCCAVDLRWYGSCCRGEGVGRGGRCHAGPLCASARIYGGMGAGRRRTHRIVRRVLQRARIRCGADGQVVAGFEWSSDHVESSAGRLLERCVVADDRSVGDFRRAEGSSGGFAMMPSIGLGPQRFATIAAGGNEQRHHRPTCDLRVSPRDGRALGDLTFGGIGRGR